MSGLATTLTTRNARAARSAPWGRVIAFSGLVTAVGLLANRWGEVGTLLLVAVCVGIPLLDRPHALRQSLHLRRRGWRLAIVLGSVLFGLPWGLMLGVRLWLGAENFQPPAQHALGFTAQHLLAALPLVVAEEIFFRGYLQETLLADHWRGRRWAGFAARTWVVALLFGLVHVSARLQPVALVTMLGGLLFGWLTEISEGQIGPAILLHLCTNVAIATTIWLVSISLPWTTF